jgi:hypothetical protein
MQERQMQAVELTWRRVLSVWWLIAWRTFLGGAIIGAVVGFIIGAVGAVVGLPAETRTVFSLPILVLLGLYWGIVVIKMALTKEYSDFDIVLVPPQRGHQHRPRSIHGDLGGYTVAHAMCHATAASGNNGTNEHSRG